MEAAPARGAVAEGTEAVAGSARAEGTEALAGGSSKERATKSTQKLLAIFATLNGKAMAAEYETRTNKNAQTGTFFAVQKLHAFLTADSAQVASPFFREKVPTAEPTLHQWIKSEIERRLKEQIQEQNTGHGVGEGADAVPRTDDDLLNQLNDEIDSFISACKEAKATQDVGVKRKHQEDVVAAGTVAEQGEARRPRLLGNSLPKPANTDTHAVLVAQTHELIAAISAGDFNKYASLCAAGLSCIEPETSGQIIKGLKFHEHYFTLPAGDGPPVHKTTTLTDLQVRASGDMGFVTYNRVTQTGSMTSVAQETRIWERSSSTGEWVQVHFHKSIPA